MAMLGAYMAHLIGSPYACPTVNLPCLANLPGGIGCKNPRVAQIAHILCSISVGYQYFGLKEDQVPLIVLQQHDGDKYLNPNLKDYKEGKFKAYNKSEPIPEVSNETVKVVVADNLNDFVLKSRKNVLLEFYASWCGRCKKLARILQETAVSLKNEEDVIAKMELN